jgi:hypothetical protein
VSAKNTAEAILYVIKTLFKWLLYVVVVLFLLGLVWYGVYSAYEWYTEGRHKEKVIVTTRFDKAICSDARFPLYIEVVNNSVKSILSTSVYVDVTQVGYSATINSYHGFTSDRIIAPGKQVGSCWRVTSNRSDEVLDGRGMEVKVKTVYVRFKD